MISTEKIATFISNPGQVHLSDVIELEALAEKHPYTQIFSMLTLKGLANEKDSRFDEILLKHSYRITNREQLYNLVHQIDSMNNDSANQIDSNLTEPVRAEEVIIEGSVSELTEELSKKDLIQLEESVNEKSDESVDEVTDEVAESEEPILEQNILHHVYANSFQLEALSAEEERALEERQAEKVKEKASDLKETQPTVLEQISFNSWLHANKNYMPADDVDTAAIHAVVNDFKDFDPLEELTGEIQKPKREFFSPAKKAKESLREETIPVSETLAKIYALQGNYPKAIEAYEQLSLNFPEKKIFFANLIKDLKKKLNS